MQTVRYREHVATAPKPNPRVRGTGSLILTYFDIGGHPHRNREHSEPHRQSQGHEANRCFACRSQTAPNCKTDDRRSG
jgi:hypothetical protein